MFFTVKNLMLFILSSISVVTVNRNPISLKPRTHPKSMFPRLYKWGDTQLWGGGQTHSHPESFRHYNCTLDTFMSYDHCWHISGKWCHVNDRQIGLCCCSFLLLHSNDYGNLHSQLYGENSILWRLWWTHRQILWVSTRWSLVGVSNFVES